MDNDAPALGVDGKLKDASDIEWHYSETDETPIPKGAPAPPDGDSSDDELVAPGGVTSSVPRRARDLPDPALIVDGSRYRKPAARVREGAPEKPGVGLRREINNFFHPKGGRSVLRSVCMLVSVVLT